MFHDDGPGMTREVLDNVYFAVGATTKSGPTQIGGMGRARILTCFAIPSYRIRSHKYEVVGERGDKVDVAIGERLHTGAVVGKMHHRDLRILPKHGYADCPAQICVKGLPIAMIVGG